MNKSTGRFAIYFAAISTLFAACGGGGGNQVSGIDGSGAPVSSYSSGTITGFGSVIVNGVRYASDKAKITVNDAQASEDSLHAGYQVKIVAHTNNDGTSTADTIEFHSNLTGVISSIDLIAQKFSLLGHTIKVTNDTLFDINISPNYLSGLAVGKTVLVSGQVDANGDIVATRVDLAATNNHQAMGIISSLNESEKTFKMRDLTINYSAAALTNFDNAPLTNGILVNATGALDNAGVLQAKTLVRINTNLDKTVKTGEIRGFITRFVSTSDFDVAGNAVTTDGQTNYDNGSVANLMAGVPVEVKGALNGSGVLVAQQIEFARAITNQIAGEVSAVTLVSSGIISTGTLQINGTSIQTNLRTAYEDNGSGQQKRFNFAAIQVGDFLKISGYNSNGNFIASKIEREEIQAGNETSLKFEGTVLSVEPHSFILFGRSVITNSQTELVGNNGEKLTEAQFYLLAVGKHVKVEGTLKNNQFTASKVELSSNEK